MPAARDLLRALQAKPFHGLADPSCVAIVEGLHLGEIALSEVVVATGVMATSVTRRHISLAPIDKNGFSLRR